MRSFLLRIVWFTLPIITVLVTSNYFGDSASLFRTEYEETIAELILDGSDVTNISNYDERLLQMLYHPALTSGMPRKQAEPLLKQIAQEVVARG